MAKKISTNGRVSKATTTTSKAAPTREEIAKRAFEIWMGRGQPKGSEVDNWVQAERELKAESLQAN